ncbi:MAG: hypothetical protein P4L72_08600 [Parvibaculum sp.]|uniref:hypothetical protein n=1 Tax=Parvibaculum sp. TaxID=2024848 RepID=UPI00283F53D8|nr:hypothetical protein [Parvibaculum sp.]MDR3499272.1 hypothetical protein [Parvibaculum sp.]
MRAFKITFALILVLSSAALTGLIYIQSQGAGISTGLLLALVILCYAYDHRHHLFGADKPAGEPKKKSTVRHVALQQGRLTAMHQDGDIAARRGH